MTHFHMSSANFIIKKIQNTVEANPTQNILLTVLNGCHIEHLGWNLQNNRYFHPHLVERTNWQTKNFEQYCCIGPFIIIAFAHQT